MLREVAIAVTDVEGSTELWEWDRETMARALEVHDNVMREEISRCAGTFVFVSVLDCVSGVSCVVCLL